MTTSSRERPGVDPVGCGGLWEGLRVRLGFGEPPNCGRSDVTAARGGSPLFWTSDVSCGKSDDPEASRGCLAGGGLSPSPGLSRDGRFRAALLENIVKNRALACPRSQVNWTRRRNR